MKNVKINNTFFTSDEQFKLYRKSVAQGKVSLVTMSDSNKKYHKIKEALAELDKNHNWSWYDEIFDRNKDNLDSVAIWFRGTEITYAEMFENADKYMKSFLALGLKKGDEVPVCIKNSPELIYLLLASSKIGVSLNIFGKGYDHDYITEILNNSKSKILFAHEDEYRKIKVAVDSSNIEKKVLFALEDSLENGIDPYHELDSKYVKFESTISELKKEDSNIFNSHDFISYGEKEVISDSKIGLDDVFTITYTSGSTNTSRPKAIVHKMRSYITMGRFHDADLSGLPSTKNMRGLVHIPPYSNTDLMTCISDVFHQRGTITIEPIYDINFFLDSLVINKPCFAPATRCFYLKAAKSILFDSKYNGLKMPYLYIPTVVGEPLSKGEQKFIEKALRKVSAGSSKVPFPISPVKLSVGGGDCEHGGLFFTLYKDWQEKLDLSKDEYGLKPFALAELAVLNNDNGLCYLGEVGRLVSTSPCTMKEYKNNKEAINRFFVTDNNGKKWGDNNVWAYLDKKKNVHIKGRIGKELKLNDGTEYPLFLLNDIVQSNYKKVLSSEVVLNTNDLGEEVPTIHIEFSPYLTINSSSIFGSTDIYSRDYYSPYVNDNIQVLKDIDNRLKEAIPSEIYEKICYRVRTFNEAFPITGSGKRNNLALQEEGISNRCIKVVNNSDDFQLYDYNSYLCYFKNDKDSKVYKKQ